MEKLWSDFFINDLLLEDGSEINGAFARAGLIDELHRAIQGRGAFRRFKDKIRYEDIEQQ